MSMQKEDFDLYTKGAGSPSKSAKRCAGKPDPTLPHLSGRYNEEYLLGYSPGKLTADDIRRA